MIRSTIIRRFFLFICTLFYPACSNCDTDHHHLKTQTTQSCVISPYEVRDLELTESHNKTHPGVFSVFDITVTVAGKERLAHNLMNVTPDSQSIAQRQGLIQHLLEHPDLVAQLQGFLVQAREYEGHARYFMHEQEDTMAQDAIDSFYFPSNFKKFNKSGAALTAKRAAQYAGLLSPIFHFAVFHYALEHLENTLRKKPDSKQGDPIVAEPIKKHNKGHVGCCKPKADGEESSWLFSAARMTDMGIQLVGMKGAVSDLYVQAQLINALHKKVIGTHKWLLAASDIAQAMDHAAVQHPGLRTFLASYTRDASDVLGVLSPAGTTLKHFKLLKQNGNYLARREQMVADVDALVSIVQWVKNTRERGGHVCFAQFVRAEKPTITMTNFWHPMLDAATVTLNSCYLGGDAHRYAVITGPNKAGKSTIIKAIGVNIILAQTYGIAAAESCVLTPFHKIISNITVADDLAHGSSTMVAEMARAQHCLDSVRALKPNEFACLIIDDSLFKGTAFDEGQKIAYNFIQELGMQANSCGLVATHLPCLTELEGVWSAIFKNYYIPLALRSGKKASSFTLAEGIADASHVLDLVKDQDNLFGGH